MIRGGRLHTFALAFALLAALPGVSLALDPDLYNCDRNRDGQITVIDAFSALKDAVNTCRRSHECDADGDYDETVSDALAILRFAVGMPQELLCSCIVFDECFGDDDCLDWGPGWICTYYLCAECDGSHPCDDGEFCDPCSLRCQPEE